MAMTLEELADARDKAGDLIERDAIRAAIRERDKYRDRAINAESALLARIDGSTLNDTMDRALKA